VDNLIGDLCLNGDRAMRFSLSGDYLWI